MKRVRSFAAVICTVILFVSVMAACGQSSDAGAESDRSQEVAAATTEAEAVEAQEEVTEETTEEETEETISAEAAAAASSESEALSNALADQESSLGAANGAMAEEEKTYLVFASEEMGFSFIYNSEHTAYISPNGAALLAIDGDEARTGLFVSVMDSENMPSPDEYFEGEIFNLQQRYLNAMAEQPQRDDLEVSGHKLTGIVYAYSTPQGETVDCAEFIEVLGDKYVFYHSRGLRGNDREELVAMGEAMGTLQFDAGYYGRNDAVKGNLPVDEFDTEYSGSSAGTPSASSDDFKSGFYFDTDGSYLIISDEDVTQVYTGGAMEGANFSVERVELSESIGDTVVSRKNEVAQMLSVRMIGEPEIQLIEIGDRRIAGFTTTYSAVDGTKTIVAEEFYEENGGETYCWYAIYDEGDETTPAAFARAMETSSLN